MEKQKKMKFELRAQIIKAMAHPTRLFIIDELSKGEKCVCELTDMIGDDISTVSKHLSIMKNVGIIESQKKGNMVYYRLKVPCIINFLGCVETILKNNVNQQLNLIK